MKHKTNWERVISAIDALGASWDRQAVETLRRELLPKYEAVKARREIVRAYVAAYRATPQGAEKNRATARAYYAAHREECNRKTIECHKRKRAADKAATLADSKNA